MNIESFERDTLRIEVTVTDSGAAYDLTDATIVFLMQRPRGTAVSGTVTVTDAAGGVFEAVYAAGTFAPGNYAYQARVTKAGDVDTVVHGNVLIKDSIEVPA